MGETQRRCEKERDRYRDALSRIALSDSYGRLEKTPSQLLREVVQIARKALDV